MGINFPTSLLSTTLRGGAGINARPRIRQPAKMLRLYDMENCPYCRLSREALTELDLDVEIYPCPKGGERYRPWVEERGGTALFPFLVDVNSGVEMYQSMDIVEYLFQQYGDSLPVKWRLGALQKMSSMLASAPRTSRGMKAQTGNLPEKMLELYSFEGSPYARPVRELLCQMEIPYVVRNCGRSEWRDWLLPPIRQALSLEAESRIANRLLLEQEQGRVSIPFLFDPNTEKGLFESSEIVNYLKAQYGR